MWEIAVLNPFAFRLEPQLKLPIVRAPSVEPVEVGDFLNRILPALPFLGSHFEGLQRNGHGHNLSH
jgi:hypothetical protein